MYLRKKKKKYIYQLIQCLSRIFLSLLVSDVELINMIFNSYFIMTQLKIVAIIFLSFLFKVNLRQYLSLQAV